MNEIQETIEASEGHTPAIEVSCTGRNYVLIDQIHWSHVFLHGEKQIQALYELLGRVLGKDESL